jgi:Zn-dependent protease with chaperone function
MELTVDGRGAIRFVARYQLQASRLHVPATKFLPSYRTYIIPRTQKLLLNRWSNTIIQNRLFGCTNGNLNGNLRYSFQPPFLRWSWTIVRKSTPCIRAATFATSNSITVAAAPTTATSGWKRWWARIALAIRYVRIPVLVVSVYSLGYQQGVIDCTKEPNALQNQILTGILISTGCTDLNDVHIINDADIKYHSFQRQHQVATVGHKIIAAARNLVETKMQQAMMVVKAKLPPDVTPENELLAMEADSDVQFFYNARLRLNGEQIENSAWQYVIIDSTIPNAFVTEILPRKFFITTAMLQVATTPDELGIVLGHEISHLILGHVSSTNKVETLLRTIEVLLLSMDPTAGLLSVLVIGTIYAARRLISAAYSRDNEIEADDLGLEIAAAACYDTVAGSKVMYKMHQVAAGMTNLSGGNNNAAIQQPVNTGNSTIVRLMDTHPPSLDRYERMLTTAQNGENYTKHKHCANISRRFFNALWGTSNHNQNDDSNTKSK